MGHRLHSEVAIVTGSTHGVGRGIALAFAEHGAAVLVTGRDADAGTEVVDHILRAGGNATFVRADLVDPSAGTAIAAVTAATFGAPTILVNNAGSSDLVRDGTDRAISEIDDAGWARILEVNLTGPMRLTRAVLKQMMARGKGSILFISSRAARVGVPGVDGYTAVKGALEALTRSIAVEYAPFGIRCNCIQVSFVQIMDERRGRPSLDADNDERIKRLLLTRGGTPSDIANAAVYLASSEAEFVTGVVVPVDGGASAVSGMPWVSTRPRLAPGDSQERSWSPGT
jgi:NAD(P)-dependent dehydrogenase (short-subunit alcohol dehydrogenase family)